MDWTASDERDRRDVERFVCLSSMTENKLKMLWLSRFYLYKYSLIKMLSVMEMLNVSKS